MKDPRNSGEEWGAEPGIIMPPWGIPELPYEPCLPNPRNLNEILAKNRKMRYKANPNVVAMGLAIRSLDLVTQSNLSRCNI